MQLLTPRRLFLLAVTTLLALSLLLRAKPSPQSHRERALGRPRLLVQEAKPHRHRDRPPPTPPPPAAAAAVLTDPLGYYSFRWEPHGQRHPDGVPAVAPSRDDQCGIMPFTDFDGTGLVAWGYGPDGLKAASAAECCDKCRANKRCNVFSWCGEPLCFAPDIWNHSFGECWLKTTPDPNTPLVNMRGSYTAKYHKRHPTAPERVQWTAGVVRWNGPVGNGTWSSRAGW